MPSKRQSNGKFLRGKVLEKSAPKEFLSCGNYQPNWKKKKIKNFLQTLLN